MQERPTMIEVEEMLDLVFQEAAPCEMPIKSGRRVFRKSRRTHTEGEWYLTLSCPYCPAQGTLLICTPCHSRMLDQLYTLSFPCGSCQTENKLKDAFVSMVRRG